MSGISQAKLKADSRIVNLATLRAHYGNDLLVSEDDIARGIIRVEAEGKNSCVFALPVLRVCAAPVFRSLEDIARMPPSVNSVVDRVLAGFSDTITLHITKIEGVDLQACDSNGLSDPFIWSYEALPNGKIHEFWKSKVTRKTLKTRKHEPVKVSSD
jgi:hypothetical protein